MRQVTGCHKVTLRRNGSVRRVRVCSRCGTSVVTIEWLPAEIDRLKSFNRGRVENGIQIAERRARGEVCREVELMLMHVVQTVRQRKSQ